MTHPYIDCARAPARRAASRPKTSSEILCEVAEGTVHRLWEPLAAKQRPPNAYAAKFATPYCIAVGFVTGDAGLAAFTDADGGRRRASARSPARSATRRSGQSLSRSLHRPYPRDLARRPRRRGAPSRPARRRPATAIARRDRGEIHGQRRLWRLARARAPRLPAIWRGGFSMERSTSARCAGNRPAPQRRSRLAGIIVIASRAKRSSDKRRAVCPGLLRRRCLLAMTPFETIHPLGSCATSRNTRRICVSRPRWRVPARADRP